MIVYRSICIEDYAVVDVEDQTKTFTLERGKEYTHSGVDGASTVMVFTRFWFRAPASIFAGTKRLGSDPDNLVGYRPNDASDRRAGVERRHKQRRA